MPTQKILLKIKNIFPELFFWIKLPAFSGWCFLSCGIMAGSAIFAPASASWIVYNKFVVPAMIILCVIALIASSRLLRLTCFFSLGLLLHGHALSGQYRVFSEWKQSLSDQKRCMLSGRVASAPCMTKGKYAFVVAADSLFASGRRGVLKGRDIICYSMKAPPLSGPVLLAGRYSPPRPNPNFGGFDPYLYSLSNNLWGLFSCDSIVRAASNLSSISRAANAVRRTVISALASVQNEEYRGILLAAFLNDQSDLTSSMKDLFFKAGIYHLLALSGFNIAILAGALLAVLFLVPLKKELKILISLLVIWLYLFFIGFIPSLFRSVIMATVVSAAFLVQRKSYLLNSLGIAGIVWLCLSPFSLFTPSYQLSFAATFGLITLSPILLKAFAAAPTNAVAKIALSAATPLAAVSLASFIATLPVLMYHFNQLYIFGIFANLFCVTLMSFSMWAALAGFVFQPVLPAFAGLCMHGAEFMIFIMIKGAGLVRFVPWTMLQPPAPYPELYVLFIVFALGIILIKKDFRLKYFLISTPVVCALVCLCFLMHGRDESARVVSFSVKNSFLAAIRWPDKRVWIIGSGPETPSFSTYRRIILPWMQKTGPCKIDAVVFPDFPGNAVQFLEPLLNNERIRRVMSLDSTCARDETLGAFLKTYHIPLELLKDREIIAVSPACTCHVYSRQKIPAGQWASFGMRINKATVFLSNEPPNGTDSLGAAMITIGKSGTFRYARAISAFHPLYIK